MKRFVLALAIVLSVAGLGAAYAQFGGGQTGISGCGPQMGGPNGCGPQIGGGPQVSPNNPGGYVPPSGSNFILMIDNTSRILQTDNASKICKAGGC